MIAQHKGEIPFITLLLPFITGICIGLWLWPDANLTIPLWVFVVLGGIFFIFNLIYQRIKLYLNKQWLGGLLIQLIMAAAGWLCTAQHQEKTNLNHFSKTTASQLVLQVNSEPKLSGRYITFTALVKQAALHQKIIPVTGSLLVITPATNQTKKLVYGDQLMTASNYTPVNPPYNPAEFNYKQYLAYQNINYQLFADPGKLVVLNHNTGNPVIAYALLIRQHMVERLKVGIKDTNAVAVASTLMLGYKADLSSDVLQAYSKTGTIHVLSVSGAHVAIIYAIITLSLSFLNRYKYGRVLNAFLSIVLIWGYALLTGFSPAVCRAALMISLFIAGRTYNRQINSLNVLAASAFILLVNNPFLLADVGFQLSYFAVFGLLAFQPVIYKQLQPKNKWVQKLWYLCSASIAAQLITFPLSIYYFHQFPVYFLLSNLLIIIPVDIIMAAGLAYLLFANVPYISVLLARVLEYTIIFMNKALAYIEHVPYASAGQLWITPVEYIILSLLIILLILFLHHRKAMQLIGVLSCFLVLTITSAFKQYDALTTNTITFLNLKQHSGIIFRAGRKAVVLADLAVTDKAFRYSVQPCLDSNKVSAQTLTNFNTNAANSFCVKRGKLVQFLNNRLLVVDTGFAYRPLKQPLIINEVFISGSPKISLNLLRQSYIYTTVIVDARNSNQAVERYRQEAGKLHKKFICLKRNKSFILTSN